MLTVHLSNRYELLCERLLSRLQQPAAHAFERDEVIVPSAGVRRALTLALADTHGICAHVQFGFLAQWLWTQIGRLVPGLPGDSPFAQPVLVWRVFDALRDRAFVAKHPRLQLYLANADAVMHHDLARAVAGLLEQYVTYRPDWLLAWSAQRSVMRATDAPQLLEDEQWQAALWRRIAQQLDMGEAHPAQQMVQALHQGGTALARNAGLPSRLHVFVLPATPPMHIDLLAALGEWMDINVYVLNPCEAYWFELIDRKRLTRLALRRHEAGHEEGNRLLAAWGRQTQAHIDTLLDRCADAVVDDELFETPATDRLLGKLQASVLGLYELQASSVAMHSFDRSVELHVCHSLTRELEVLHERLLGLFANDRTLHPADVLVALPDLQTAAPLVEAVFGTMPPARRIPFFITGRARSEVNPLARALLDVLALAGSRCHASDLLGLLQQPVVARRFSLDSLQLAQLQRWLKASGVRWGLSARHLQQLSLPTDGRHTLAKGLERLFLAYALPDDIRQPLVDTLPAGRAEGASAQLLGSVWQFSQALDDLQAELTHERAPEAWGQLLLQTLQAFTRADEQSLEDERDVRHCIGALTDAMRSGLPAGGATVPAAVLLRALAQQLEEPAQGGVPTGGVTFAAMSSLRSLPWRVVCVLGLNDGQFPSSRSAPEFDLMATHGRRGDRQRRDDDRNLFLDLVLAARDILHLSHSGHSVRDNTALPPSVLVSELLDVLVPALAHDSSASAQQLARAQLVVQHPLQAFAFENFDGTDPRLHSHDDGLARALRDSLQAVRVPRVQSAEPASALGDVHDLQPAQPDADPDIQDTSADDAAQDDNEALVALPQIPFVSQPLPALRAEDSTCTLTELSDFLCHPSRALLQRLGLRVHYDEEALSNAEPFAAERQDTRALAARLLPAMLAGASAADIGQMARAGTEMPGGPWGEQVTQVQLALLGSFAQRVRAACPAPDRPPHTVRLQVLVQGHSHLLEGALHGLQPTGCVRWRHDDLRASDVLRAWVQHLALCAQAPKGLALATQVLALDGDLRFRAVDTPAQALLYLQQLLELRAMGLCQPLHYFPKAAWLFINGLSINAVRSQWAPRERGGPHYAESLQDDNRLVLRGRDEPPGQVLDAAFEALAHTVFGPVLAHVQGAIPGVSPPTPARAAAARPSARSEHEQA